MQLQRVRDTAPELNLRRELHRRGLRYRLDRQVVPGTRRRVDITFAAAKVAVLVDGCFWHGCPLHGVQVPKANQQFWVDKIATNQARDADTDVRLAEDGWLVIRVWEHEDPVVAAERITVEVRGRRPA
jgi:DNA mismatch endonuclease (patch repair protein)